MIKWGLHRLAHLIRMNGCKTEWLGEDRTELWVVCATCGKKHEKLAVLTEEGVKRL